jgi:cephalosporin-C deacetylase-like acetyl esterase
MFLEIINTIVRIKLFNLIWRIALWGTSFAGGHTVVAAAQLDKGAIKAVISQVPHMNGTN